MIIQIVKEINDLLRNGQPYSALGMALALPDICGGIEHPNWPSGKRYPDWFDKYVLTSDNPIFKNDVVSLNGDICYKLRCAYLHNGHLNPKPVNNIHIKQFTIFYDRNMVFRFCNVGQSGNGDYHMEIDLGILCFYICRGATCFYEKYHGDCDNKIVEIKDVTPDGEVQAKVIRYIENQAGLSFEQIKNEVQENSRLFNTSNWQFPINNPAVNASQHDSNTEEDSDCDNC